MMAVTRADAVVDVVHREGDVEVLGPQYRLPGRRERPQRLVAKGKRPFDDGYLRHVQGDDFVRSDVGSIAIDVVERVRGQSDRGGGFCEREAVEADAPR